MRYNNILLGTTKDNEIVFADVEITTRNGYKEFTASFSTVRPFCYNDIDLEEYVESILDEYDKSTLYDMCCNNDCRPSELAEIIIEQESIYDIMDLSLYPELYIINDSEWYFESSSCGQHDTREEMEFYTNKEYYDKLHELWDKWHLEKITDDIENEVISIMEELCKVNEEEWIKNYIEENMI